MIAPPSNRCDDTRVIRTRSLLSLLLCVLVTIAAHAQTAVVAVTAATPRELNPNSPQTIYSTPPTLTLIQHTPDAHPGSVWLRSTPEGLHIWLKVQADEQDFRWPQQKSEMLSSDHIELWLAASPSVPMPPVGWGNQFGMTTLNSEKDCQDQTDSHTGDAATGARNCVRWYAEQFQYRQSLRRLFVRQWLIAGPDLSDFKTHTFEEFASSAYTTLRAELFDAALPKLLAPNAEDGLVAEFGTQGRPEIHHNAANQPYTYNHQTGYTAHIFIRYNAFPPSQQFTLRDLYLMVDVFSNAPTGQKQGAWSTTSPNRRWGQPETFNHIQLQSPQHFSITPCDAVPHQADLYGDDFKPWFFPTQPTKDSRDPLLTSTFALINPEQGYLYDPGGESPEADGATYYSHPLATGAILCGPALAWRKGDQIKRSKLYADPTNLGTKTPPDGWTLVQSGPLTTTLSPFGSGECGACPVMNLDLFAISPTGDITSAFNLDQVLSGEGDNPDSADLTLTPDWQHITAFFETTDYAQTPAVSNWTSTTYCLSAHTYKQCASSDKATPPKPANFPELRGDN
jgi:hypothetical protein